MRVERSTKDQMLGRLSQLAKEKEKQDKSDDFVEETNYADLVKAKDKDEALRKEEKRKKRKEKRKQKRSGLAQATKSENDEAEEKVGKAEEKEDSTEEVEVESESIDPAMAAMMGFSGFGGGNKTG